MDVELVKFMSATRDLIYATLGLVGLMTMILAVYFGVLIKRLFAAAQNGYQPTDTMTVGFYNKESAKAATADANRVTEAVAAVIAAFEKRHVAQMAEYRYQRKKMNMLLIIQRRLHDFTILHRMPTTNLPPIDEADEAPEEIG